MENRNLILMLLEKSINAFGRVIGLSEEDKLKAALLITQSTIQDSFDINSVYLSEKTLEGILAENKLNIDQAQLLTNLLWTQAEILFKLDRKEDSLKQYFNTIQLLKWKEKQSFEKGQLERKNKIIEIESIISELKNTEKLAFPDRISG